MWWCLCWALNKFKISWSCHLDYKQTLSRDSTNRLWLAIGYFAQNLHCMRCLSLVCLNWLLTQHCYNSHINNSTSFCGFRLSLGGLYSIRLTTQGINPEQVCMPCNLILARLVKVPWQAWPIFGPTNCGQCRPIKSQTFLLFLARLCQFWPRPVQAMQTIYVICFSFSILALANRGQAGPGWPCGRGFPSFFIPWPTWPKPGHKPGSPRLSGQVLTPVWLGSWCKGALQWTRWHIQVLDVAVVG